VTQLKWLVHSAGKIGYFAFVCKLFSRFLSRCPFSGVELRGQEHPKKFWFDENSGTEVSTRLFTTELSDFFLRRKTTFLVQCKCAHSWG